MDSLIDRATRWARTTPGAEAYRYVDYTTDPAGVPRSLTWSQVDTRARAVAARIRQHAVPGDRVALLAPPGLDYVVALLGACYSRVIAVPLFTPDLPLHGERLRLAFNDSAPESVLTTAGAVARVEDFLTGDGIYPPHDLICVDDLTDALAAQWQPESLGENDIAYLQYTSGSTGDPAGVEITHGNLTANAEQIWRAFSPTPGNAAMVSWLPLFHDMGLMLTALLPLIHGDVAVFTDPVSFLMRPARWLELTAQPCEVYTAGPNFAYDYCVKRISDAEKDSIDLSSVRGFMNGAEPVRAATITRFTEAFALCGLSPRAHTPVYGLAEATVFVTGSSRTEPPVVTEFDTDALNNGHARPAVRGIRTVALAACGTPHGQQVRIVDPDTRQPCGPDRVGEIQVSGPNVAHRYWRNPQRSAAVFIDGWLRTGDLGVFHNGQLYLTGRLKDLVIIDGRNHYPQDIEATAHEAHPQLRAGRVAAFSVPGADTERLIVVAEYDGADPAGVHHAIRIAVKARHDLRTEVLITEPGTISRTTSGKLARRATRDRYLAGELATCES